MQGKIVSLSITHYYGTYPDGTFTFQHEHGTLSHKLDKEEVERIWAIAYEAIERTKHKIADDIRQIETPTLLGYDRTKTIEASDASEDIQPPASPPQAAMDDEIPF